MRKSKSAFKDIFSRGTSFLLIAAFLCIGFFAFSRMDKTAAWLASNNEISSSNLSVVARDIEDLNVNLTSYAVSKIADTNTGSKLDNQYTLSSAGVYELPTYDPNNISYSIYQKALVVTLQIHVENAATLNISLNASDEPFSNAANNVFSNCMQIMPATLNTTPDGTSSYATPSGEPMSFVAWDGETASKTDPHIPLETIYLEAGDSVTRCYVIEYLDDFSYIFKPSTEVSEISFFNDIEFIIASSD